MKLSRSARSFAASLVAAALFAPLVPARQAGTRQPPPKPARAGEARGRGEARPNAKSETQERSKSAAQPREKAEARGRDEAADSAEVSLDELFAADAYAVYGELRMVGQHFGSEEFRRLLEPLRLTGATPPDLVEMYEFVAARAEQLAGARVAFAGVPVRSGLPSVVAAVELPSAEEARKFAPQLREFLVKSAVWGGAGEGAMAETVELVEPVPADAPPDDVARRVKGRRQGRGANTGRRNAAAATRKAALKEEALPFHLRQAGAVVALADAPFTFKRLRGGADTLPLAADAGFAAARSRLAADTLFLYFNTARLSAATRRQMDEAEREHRRVVEEEMARERESAAARNPDGAAGEGARVETVTVQTTGKSGVTVRREGPNPNSSAGPAPGEAVTTTHVDQATGEVSVTTRVPVGPDGRITPEGEAELRARLAEAEEGVRAHEEQQKKLSPEEQARRQEAERQRDFENRLGDLIFSGGPFSPSRTDAGSWPEAIGVGASFAGEEVVVRAFLVSESEDKPARPLPFMPILHAGPQVASEAANVLPEDTDILVSASLDLPQMYDYVASVFRLLDLAAAAAGEGGERGLFDSQVGAFEKQLKFKIRDDLISALGNEMAVAFPAGMFGVRRTRRAARPRAESGKAADGGASPEAVEASGPVVLLALKDKRAVQELLPRALGALGVPGLSADQLLQKQGEAELLTFAGGGVAFIENFLVVSFDPRAMERVVKAYNEGRTLGRSRLYRDPVDWQPRQIIGQAYVSNAMLRDAFGDAHASIEDIEDERLRAHLAALDPEPGAITLAATRDAAGITHELHVPKNLLNLWTASTLVSQNLEAMRSNEARAIAMLYNISQLQADFKKDTGRYAGFAELKSKEEQRHEKEGGLQHIDPGSFFTAEGYDIRLTATGDSFEATATPTGYPRLGRRSFYIDQTGRLRGGDLGGRPASSSSEPMDN